ncbi:amino acid transporter-like protein [Dactylonectria estremocensis]|uniref:Amino acid transporter-like protein n=1 Tax=Dactylonectria estremocensis TaxID=1079267 RepID=A0A9P9J6T6_9HYPO|nr:amino acid transporter-like protein [Dactylonectria estremocensis]
MATTTEKTPEMQDKKKAEPGRLFAGPIQDEEEELAGEISEWEKKKRLAGNAKFHRLGWKRLTIILIVEAVALGALSLPACFATLGMVPGTLCCVFFGLVAIYAGHNVGELKVKYPEVQNYADAGRLMFGRVGYEFVSAIFLLELIFVSGSHCLTGTIAFRDLTNNGACALVFGVVSAIILFAVSVPPSFTEMAILGYIDFASILIAIGITIIATGVQASDSAGGMSAVDWSAWPRDGVTAHEVFVAIVNIILAYTFTLCQFSFMDEMHTPAQYPKAVWATGIVEIFIYTLTGALVYAFVGNEVQSPALLSGGPTISKIAFGVALPVIFISGAVITQCAARLVHGRIYENRVERYVNTTKGWISWLATVLVIVIIGWVIAEAIPFFSNLVALISSLFNSGFALYLPALMWFMLLREGAWNTRENLIKGAINGFMFVAGMVVLVGGTWASVKSIVDDYNAGNVGGSFTCS